MKLQKDCKYVFHGDEVSYIIQQVSMKQWVATKIRDICNDKNKYKVVILCNSVSMVNELNSMNGELLIFSTESNFRRAVFVVLTGLNPSESSLTAINNEEQVMITIEKRKGY